jgi:hypothetical protein
MVLRLLQGSIICSTLLLGQPGGRGEQSIRATIRGGGGNEGKCTAEVEVDGAAEVTISGETGRIRTLAGQPARWRRLDCSSPLPRTMSDFRFRGIDGRGRQDLVQDPRRGGVAVVRISDTKGGREGYTFDLEWRGAGSFGGGGGGFPGGGGGNWGNNSGGWNNSWGDSITYRGRGRGNFARAGGQRYEIHAVDVVINRGSGQVVVNMDTNMGRDSLAFTGRIQRISGDTIYADVRAGSNRGDAAGANGSMRIAITGNRRVRAIDMDGRVAGGRFNLSWQD